MKKLLRIIPVILLMLMACKTSSTISTNSESSSVESTKTAVETKTVVIDKPTNISSPTDEMKQNLKSQPLDKTKMQSMPMKNKTNSAQ